MSHHKSFGWLLWLALVLPLTGIGQSAPVTTSTTKQRFGSLQQALSAG